MKTFNAPLLGITKETRDVKTFRFKADIDFRPGQFVMLKVGDRSEAFSICSSPTDIGYIDLTMKMTQSDYKKALDLAKEGKMFEIKGPYGVFILDESKDAIMLSGGIGITPFRCMIRYATSKKLPMKIDLLYSNKTPEDIAFRDELDDMKKQNPNLTILNTITRPEDQEWKGATGRISAEMIKKVQGWQKRIFYICGPTAMVDGMNTILSEFGTPKESVKFEKFGGY